MFERLELLIGNKINLLKEKTVMLIGLGGVGSYAFESLLRSGVGTIIVVDSDTIDETNLNRQLLALKSNIGQFKVDEAEKRKNLINPDCQIVKIKEFITAENLASLFTYHIDFLIDAEDTLKTKKLLIKAALQHQIKFISVMGTGNKMEASKLVLTDLKHTAYDPLARNLRNYIKKEHINQKIPVIASMEKPIKSTPIGSNAFVPAVAGLLATSYAINELLKED